MTTFTKMQRQQRPFMKVRGHVNYERESEIGRIRLTIQVGHASVWIGELGDDIHQNQRQQHRYENPGQELLSAQERLLAALWTMSVRAKIGKSG